MIRAISITAVCLILTSANSGLAQKPFKNKTARTAKKSYEQAIAQAKKEYVAKLEIAIKEAGGAGDFEEAKLLVAEKKRIDGTDPLTAFRRRLIGTKWNNSPRNRKNWSKFLKQNAGVDYKGKRFIWYVTAKRTVVKQYPRDFGLNIYVEHFDANLRTGTGHTFTKHSTFPLKRVR